MAMASAITTADVDAVDADAATRCLSIAMVMVSVTISALTAETMTATASRTERTTIISRREMEAVAVMVEMAKGVIDKSVLCAWNGRALFLFF